MSNKAVYYTLLHQLALRAKWICRPNPAVAALVIKNHRIISWGYTQPVGKDHAEQVALKKLGSKARGAQLYVTLMPCSFHSKTPPCTDIIISSGIKEVHVAGFDNDVRMSSTSVRGHINYRTEQILRQAGITLHFDCPPEVAKKLFFLNWDYFKRNAVGLPTFTLKYAMSVDGKIAPPPRLRAQGQELGKAVRGEIKISGKQIKSETHNERAQHDAILVGGNTLRNDNPRLNVRFGERENQKSFRMYLEELYELSCREVISRQGVPLSLKYENAYPLVDHLCHTYPFTDILPDVIQPLPMIMTRSPQNPSLYLMKKKNPSPLFIIPSSKKKYFSSQKKVLFNERGEVRKMDLYTWLFPYSPLSKNFWKAMAKEFDIHSIFLEGGAILQSRLWGTGLIDRIHVYISPCFFLSAQDALSPFTSYIEPMFKKSQIAYQIKDIWQPRISLWGQDIKLSGFIESHLAKKLWRQLFPIA